MEPQFTTSTPLPPPAPPAMPTLMTGLNQVAIRNKVENRIAEIRTMIELQLNRPNNLQPMLGPRENQPEAATGLQQRTTEFQLA